MRTKIIDRDIILKPVHDIVPGTFFLLDGEPYIRVEGEHPHVSGLGTDGKIRHMSREVYVAPLNHDEIQLYKRCE